MAYEGKFSKPRNTEANIRAKAEARKQAQAAAAEQKPAAPVKQAVPAEKKPAAPVKQTAPAEKKSAAPVKQAVPAEKKPAAPVKQAVPAEKKPAAPVKQAAPAEKKSAAPVKQAAPAEKKSETPVEKKPVPAAQKAPEKKPAKKRKKKNKANRNVTIVFYTVYFVMIAAFLVGMLILNGWLNNFLVKYEAAQPTTKCQEVFLEHFADPDWKQIYTMAGMEDTAYEGADAFADYMEEKVGSGKITYVETSAGLSGGHKYLLKLDNTTLGYFTLTDTAAPGAEMPVWELDKVAIQVAYGKTVRVQTLKGHQVSVNGVALEEEDIVQVATTLAGNYLPAGVSAPTTCIFQAEGLMAEPEITVTDENGNPTTVEYDLESGMYIEKTDLNTIGEDEEEVAMAAAEVYAKYMIEEANYSHLAKYYDSTSKIYKTITSMQLWMQGHDGYEFANQEVSQYCRYSGKLFSARVALSLNVTRRNGTVKEYTVDSTLFFKHNGSRWVVYDMTNVDVQSPIAEVRLTFKSGDSVLFTNLYENDVPTITAPMVTAPEGKVFAGWFRQTVTADGKVEYTQVFAPTADGLISLPNGTKLEPMTLYALFENASQGGNE